MAVELDKDGLVELPEEIQEEYIVDADIHLSTRMLDDLLPYIDDDRIRDKLERPMGKYQFEAVPWLPAWANKEGGFGLDSHGDAKTEEHIAEAMAQLGTDEALVTSGLNSLPQVSYPRMQDAVCRAYNDYLLDRVTNRDRGIRGQLMLPLWDPDSAVAELDRLGDEKDIAGAYGWFSREWVLGKPEYDPVFEKLVDLDLPLSLHVDTSFWEGHEPIGDAMRTWSEAIGFAPCMYAMMNTVNMILTGVFDKFPDLNVVYQEGGVNWIPFLAYRIDEYYQHTPHDVQLVERMFDADQRYLDRLPSEYLYDNFHVTTQPLCKPKNPRHYEWLLKLCMAEDMLIFSSDWPHSTNDPPTWVIEEPHIDEELRGRIFHETAEEVYRI